MMHSEEHNAPPPVTPAYLHRIKASRKQLLTKLLLEFIGEMDDDLPTTDGKKSEHQICMFETRVGPSITVHYETIKLLTVDSSKDYGHSRHTLKFL